MSKKTLTLSIVIPAYNEERYLKACLGSIAKQEVQPDEILVVDNNSVDATAQIALRNARVKILHETKQGVFYASQRGFSATRSDIIARIDADSLLPPGWVRRVINDFEKDKSLAATTGPVTYYDMPLSKYNWWFNHLMCAFTYRHSPTTPFLYGSNMAVRRRNWQPLSKSLCTDRNIHEDIDLAVHFYLAGLKIKYDKKLLAGASGRRYNDSLRDFRKYLSMFPSSYRQHGLYGRAVFPALFMWSLGYILIHPWLNLWYILHKRYYIGYRGAREARKNPMAG